MNKAKLIKIGLIILVAGATITVSGCSLTGGNAATTAPTTATVTKGDLPTFISASGNLSYPDTQDIRLQVGGTVSEVLVQAGDMVKAGDVLVRLDDSTIQDKIKTDQLAINNAKIALEKVTNVYQQKTYPYTVSTFAIDIPYAVNQMSSAQSEVTIARDALAKAKTLGEISTAQTQLNNAINNLDNAINKLTFGQGAAIYSNATGTPKSLTTASYWDLRSAQLDIETSQANLDKVNNDLASDQADLTKTVVTAPFDGLVVIVPATDGAVMNTNNVAVTMTNPNKLEADILVNEIDIFNVKINGTATVSVDAVQGLTVPAVVTYVQPTATIQSGVVNYSVKVELNQTPKPSNSTQQTPATPTGKPAGTSAVSAVPFAALREGLSVTVNILKTNDKNVLLVPNRAIIRQGTTATVQVVNNTGAIENRTVTTGSTDNKNTAVTSGLAEGEKVIVQKAATGTAAPAAGGLFGGGGGARPPVAGGAVVGR